MCNRPVLSIIVAAYNVEHYIEQCLQSLLTPTLFNKEILIINDGSTDQTLNRILNITKDNKECRVISQENSGLSAVRNRGIQEAQGTYLWFVDGDDYVDMPVMQQVLSQLLADKPQVIALSHIKVYSKKQRPFGLKGKKMVTTGSILLTRLLRKKIYNSGAQFYLWQRSFLTKNNLTFLVGLVHEDIPFTFASLLKAQTTCYATTPCYFYRQNRAGSITYQFNQKRLTSVASFLPVLQQALTEANENENAVLCNHIAAVVFELLHLILYQPDTEVYLQSFLSLHLKDIILQYSKTGKYKLSAWVIQHFGLQFYAFIYKLLAKNKRLG